MMFTGSLLRKTDNIVLLLALFELFSPAVTVKHENFKTCQQSGFCRRNRALADKATAAAAQWASPYELNATTISFNNGQLSASLFKTVQGRQEPVELPLTFSFLSSGVARIQVDELRRQKGEIELRGESKARKERYNEAEKHVIVGGMDANKDAEVEKSDKTTTIKYGVNKAFTAVMHHKPFSVHFIRDKETHIILNDRDLINVEHWRPKPEAEDSEENADSGWEESFGGNTDSKPRGPESVGLDITFPGYNHVYGIPEHATGMDLKSTRGGEGNYNEPYRLYNADVFEYIADSPMTLYGSIPFMQAHKKGSTVGVLWLNAAETWVDVVKEKAGVLSFAKDTTKTHWFSEAGILDIFVFLGPSTKDILKNYGELTGYSALPQSFAIASHQSRWNYVSQSDVKEVDKKFDRANIPYDVIWLDIEYTEGKKYFTFDPLTFPKPLDMGTNLAKRDRKLVVIIDPHIKNTDNYPIVNQLKEKGLAVLNSKGEVFEGWCWPGSSHWIDCFNPAAIEWWKSLFTFKAFTGTMKNTFIWNDMNEPSVFNGPETTMPKDNLHYGNWEHRDLHNLNGQTYFAATSQALEAREGKGYEKRPFVLTRAFFSGSQRYGAMWTGDNQAAWEHLEVSIPMVLNQGISGFPFSGADIGGFFGNPSKELLTRWYQTGIFYPFMRAHAHIDAKRREPYIPGDPYTTIIRNAVRLRYALLPTWYTAFHTASTTGMPIIVPHYIAYPDDEEGFKLDDQFFIGDSGLLAKPVVREGATSVSVYFPSTEPYFDYFDYTKYTGKGSQTIDAPLDKIPLFMQGGHIFARKDRHRRSSALMKNDPYTLVIALNSKGDAEGSIYVDDGETFDYRKGSYVHRKFTFSAQNMTLSSINLHPNPSSASSFLKTVRKIRVEKIIIVGASTAFGKRGGIDEIKAITLQNKKKKEVTINWYDAKDNKAEYVIIKDPKVLIGLDWEIKLGFEGKMDL